MKDKIQKLKDKLKKKKDDTPVEEVPVDSPVVNNVESKNNSMGGVCSDQSGASTNQKTKEIKAAPPVVKEEPLSKRVVPKSIFINYEDTNMGTLFLYFSETGEVCNDGVPLLKFVPKDTSKIPGHKYTGRGVVPLGSNFGAQTSIFYKTLLTGLSEIRRYDMKWVMMPEFSVIPFVLHMNYFDDTIDSLLKENDVFEGDATKLRAVTATSISNTSYKGAKKMTKSVFAMPEGSPAGGTICFGN